VFDALSTKRPYKNPYPIEVVLKIIKDERGKHFDPEITDVFLESIDEILRIREEVGGVDDSSALSKFQWSERDASG
jgi:putative two-component system response regulator